MTERWDSPCGRVTLYRGDKLLTIGNTMTEPTTTNIAFAEHRSRRLSRIHRLRNTMNRIALLLAALVASSAFATGTGTQPPPPVLRWECNCTAWAVVWEHADGSRIASTGDAMDMTGMLVALMDANGTMNECFAACREACNFGMPPGSPNAMCSATWIGATQTCQCICRNLAGDCPATPALPVVPPQTQYDFEVWTLDIAWTKRHTGR